MILIESGYSETDPARMARRAEVMECLPWLGHAIHEFSTPAALAEYLEQGLDQMERAGYPRGLRRVVMVFRSPRAVRVVADRMAPGHEFVAWPDPDAWDEMHKDIDNLRARARKAGAIL